MRLGLAVAVALAIPTMALAQQPDPQHSEQALRACAPTSLDAAVACLEQHLPEASKAQIVALPFDELMSLHMGLGMWIRNNWGLWGGGPLQASLAKVGFLAPDDMSTVIINSYWLDHHHCPRLVAEQVQFYREYWNAAQSENQHDKPGPSGVIVWHPPQLSRPHLDCTTPVAGGSQ